MCVPWGSSRFLPLTSFVISFLRFQASVDQEQVALRGPRLRPPSEDRRPVQKSYHQRHH